MSSSVLRSANWNPLSGGRGTPSSAGRHARFGTSLSLIYLKTKQNRERTAKPVPSVVYQTVHQKVYNLYQVNRHQVFHKTDEVQYLRTDAYLLLMPPALRRERMEWEGAEARPTRTAQRLIHLFSKDSAQKQLRPFYSDIVRSVLREEQNRYRSKPAQAISLIWNLFGRQQAFRTLTRFYMSAVEKLGTNYYPALHGQNALYLAAGVVMNSQVYRHYVRQLWSREGNPVPLRYAHHQQALTDDILKLQVARRVLPPQEPLEEMVRSQQTAQADPAPTRMQEVHLSESDFRALVQGVATSLGRQTHLETLRRGGI